MGSKRNRNKLKKAMKKAGADPMMAIPSLAEVSPEQKQKMIDDTKLIDEIIAAEMKKHIHVDDFIDTNFGKETYARFVLNHFRLPAALKIDFDEYMKGFKLFCTWNDARYRVTGASRMGDIWLTDDFDQDVGYKHRVFIEEVGQFGPTP